MSCFFMPIPTFLHRGKAVVLCHGKGEVRGFQFSACRVGVFSTIYRVTVDSTIHFEVFEKRINKQYGCESYPGSKSFGQWAWTYPTENQAVIKFRDIESAKFRKAQVSTPSEIVDPDAPNAANNFNSR